ncbi:MAG: 3-hydroxyacyl-CoA dehydrogenase NAD-binding domain-containing protein, partial [bacterium]|nr:3-hydroxyacyl-CoA dehydrogenase NAD-binding domain-containing protein [bacterium]
MDSQAILTGAATLELEERLARKTAAITVIGGGYVGLPLALAFARRGYPVRILDVDGEKVAALNAGRSYIGDIPSDAVR